MSRSKEISDGIIAAFEIRSDGTGRPLEGSAVSDLIADDRLAWVHLNGSSEQSRLWLEKEITYLDHIIIDALLAEETRPRILDFEHGVLMILRGVNLNENAEPEDMVSIRLWVDVHRIISIETLPLRATTDMIDKIQKGKGPKNSGDFIVMLIARMFERMEKTFSDLTETLDEIEEEVVDTPVSDHRQSVTTVRKQALTYRRYIGPQRDVLAQLRTSEQAWIELIHKRRIQESLDRVIRYLEDLDLIRERAQIIKDELMNIMTDKMNKNMYRLSIVTAIFLPLGLLTGLFGINVGGMPGADNTDAFMVFSLILVGILIVQFIFFKVKKWF